MIPPDSPSELESRWAALLPPGGMLLSAESVVDWAGGRILAALDSDAHRHLLVQVPAGAPRPAPVRPLQGLSCDSRDLRVDGTEGRWIDLALGDARGEAAFTLLCADVLHAAGAAPGPDPAVVTGVVERYRRFWSPASDGLGREARLGLTGELWLLLEWLPVVTPASLAAWQGPLGGRHDWVTPDVSVEVKTTGSATGPVVHRVHSLDQLDHPGTGTLYLLSVRAVSDPLGGHSLHGLVARARAAATAAGDPAHDALDERLGALGWSLVDEGRWTDPFRVTSQALYRVDDTFPRLTRQSFPDGLPAAVTDVAYGLDASACDEWKVASSPSASGPLSVLAG